MVSNAPELGEQTVGIIGLGDIGTAAARLLRPFGCTLYYYTPSAASTWAGEGFSGNRSSGNSISVSLQYRLRRLTYSAAASA